MDKRALFIGRWQPLHNGHRWLINQKLEAGTPVLLAVRDIPPDDNNPFTTEQTVQILHAAYKDCNVEIITIPDIESVNYGRGVGYQINEHVPPNGIEIVSATAIRDKVRRGDVSWKEDVDPRTHDLIEKFLISE